MIKKNEKKTLIKNIYDKKKDPPCNEIKSLR